MSDISKVKKRLCNWFWNHLYNIAYWCDPHGLQIRVEEGEEDSEKNDRR